VSKYLGFQLRNPRFPNEPITIRQIASHLSSLMDGPRYDDFLTASYTNKTVPILQDYFVKGGKYYSDNNWHNHKPGDYFYYANTNFGVMGTLIEAISGTRFDLFMETELFSKLSLGCRYNVDHLDNYEDLAALYIYDKKQWTPLMDNYNGKKPDPRVLVNYKIGSNGFVFGPQGGLRASPSELEVLLRFHYNRGKFNGTQLISTEAMDLMHQPAWIYNGTNGDTSGALFKEYGFAHHIRTGKNGDYVLQNHVMKGHPGSAYGLHSDFYYEPNLGYGVIFLTNGAMDNYPVNQVTGFTKVESEVFEILQRLFF